MEAASRPSLELLPDLPVEAPLDSSAPRKDPPAAARAGAAAAAAPKPAATRDPEQTGLNFLDPEMFLAPGEPPPAAPEATPAPPAQDAVAGLELVLEDPVVDDMLTTPPVPAPAATPVAPAAAAAKKEVAAESAPSDAPRSARVPIARTGSLSSPAGKVATAAERSAPRVDPPKAAPARPAVTAVPSARAAPAPAARSDAAPPAASPKAAAIEAPSLASWTSARAAASPPVKTPAVAPKSTPPAAAAKPSAPPSPPVVSAAPAAAPAKSATVKPPAAATPAAAASSATPAAAAPAPMDRDFIARNQVVERYLSGRLPLKGATDFERFCAENPQILDEIGLPERVNAGLRLLEASGKPEPWQEAARPVWQKVQVTLGLAAAVAVFALTLAFVSLGSASKSHRIAELQKESAERALDPATSTRVIRLVPSREGASNSPAITIGGIGGSAQLADIRIDESRSPYHAFRVTIDRIDQGRVAILGDLAKDSNGHLRIALNSSALGPGNYQLTLEGLDWRGDPQPDSWVTIGITH
jgi:hypothetical protein